MKLAVKPNQMKLLSGTAGVLGLALRTVLYAAGVDRKGLLIRGYWADNCLWLLTAAVAAVLLLWCRHLPESENRQTSPLGSVSAAAGSVLAGVAFLLTSAGQAPSELFAALAMLLRIAAAISMFCVGYCRFQRKTPPFLLHCAVCLHLALRLVCQYRDWSADPQLQNYVFYMGAHVALMITAYQFAAFDAGFGNRRNLWAAGLAAIYLSIVSLAGTGDPFFLICCIFWVCSNLSQPIFKKVPRTSDQPKKEELS